MRASNYRKNFKIDKKLLKMISIGLMLLLVAGIIFFFVYFRVEHVEVMGSNHYSEEEIQEMILRGPMASNSVLAPILYSTDDAGDIPFVEGFRVSQMNRNTIVISVKEKQPVGCIPYLDSYVYFDRNGIFIESSKERDESVPYFDGIQVDYVIKNEKLPIKGTTVLNTAVALSTIFQKNDMIPDHIEFDSSYHISLVYGDITVQLGKDEYLEDKMARVIAILPKLTGKKGILHLENVNDTVKTITFEQEEVEYTSENWPGGYDENGDYTGYDEYDAEGNYVGPKPESELDYALENWVGGYDEELDYTGSGEYDQNGNYVGPAPTQESLDARGDWKGGYNENGGYDGIGEYDKDGNYVGPNPNADTGTETDSIENTGDGDSSYNSDYDSNYDSDYYDGYDSDYSSDYDSYGTGDGEYGSDEDYVSGSEDIYGNDGYDEYDSYEEDYY